MRHVPVHQGVSGVASREVAQSRLFVDGHLADVMPQPCPAAVVFDACLRRVQPFARSVGRKLAFWELNSERRQKRSSARAAALLGTCSRCLTPAIQCRAKRLGSRPRGCGEVGG